MWSVEYLNDNFINGRELELKSTRDAYGEAMVVLGQENGNVVALNANLESSVKLTAFTERFPERSFQVGVAEQNMASIANGLALYGKIPYYSSFAAFSPGLNFSHIRLACISNANVKIASTHYGLNVGEDGVTAQMLEDVAMLRALPGLTIVTPVDAVQAFQAVFEVSRIQGPVYIRFTREKFPVIMKEGSQFEIGKAQILKEGNDVTIVATGSMVHMSLMAAKKLEAEGTHTRVINVHTIKPIDKDALIKAAIETGGIVTVEEHQVHGGLGSAVAEVISQNHPVKMKMIGVSDAFGESGKQYELYEKHGLTIENIISNIKSLIN